MPKLIFSPSGGTKKAAEALYKQLSLPEEKFIDLTDINRDFSAVKFTDSDICLIAVPSFKGRVPALAAERILKTQGGGARAVLAAVFGNRAYDDTLLELKDTAVKAGYVPIAAAALNAEHSIMRLYGAGRPDAQDLEDISSFAAQIKAKIESGSTKDFTVPGKYPYCVFPDHPMPIETDTGCISCRQCAQKCPAGAISLKNPADTDLSICISCMRCISACPQNAKHLNSDILQMMSERMAPLFAGRKPNELFL